MSMTIVLIALVGIIFVYSAIKGVDPRELIKQALRRGGN